MECLQEVSGLIFIRLRKCEKDFGEECGGRVSSQEERGQHYECQNKGKASFTSRHSVRRRRLVLLEILRKLISSNYTGAIFFFLQEQMNYCCS